MNNRNPRKEPIRSHFLHQRLGLLLKSTESLDSKNA